MHLTFVSYTMKGKHQTPNCFACRTSPLDPLSSSGAACYQVSGGANSIVLIKPLQLSQPFNLLFNEISALDATHRHIKFVYYSSLFKR